MPTKIAPRKGPPQGNFTIIDNPERRLGPGAMAVFVSASGLTYNAPLQTHKPWVTAKGDVPAGIPQGQSYTVRVHVDNVVFQVGTFGVEGLALPSIAPASGIVGTAFAISDAGGRIQQGDLAYFFQLGEDPLTTAVPATNVTVASGEKMTGEIPNVPTGLPYQVLVQAPVALEPRFDPLDVYVEPQVVIMPSSGMEDDTFSIIDGMGRIQPGDVAVFYAPGDLAGGRAADGVSVADDGTSLSGRVPAGVNGVHKVAVCPLSSKTVNLRFLDPTFLCV